MTHDVLPENPVVSVLCTTYNHRDYIGQAIEGVLAQRTDFPIELIVRDDASTDGTREIVDAYARRHPGLIRAVHEPENRYRQGIRPLQAALAHARGEFVAVCEGDDYWTDPSKLQRQVNLLRSRPEVGLVHTGFDDLIQHGGQWRRIPGHQRRARKGVPEGRVFEQLLAGNFIQTCTVCLRTELARAYFTSGLPVANYPVGDWPLFLFVAATHGTAFIHESMAVYRRTPGSMMNSGHIARSRMISAQIDMIDDICDRMFVKQGERIKPMRNLYRHLLYTTAFARDRAGLRRAAVWLGKNDKEFFSPWRRRMLPAIAMVPLASWILSKIQHLRMRRTEKDDLR